MKIDKYILTVCVYCFLLLKVTTVADAIYYSNELCSIVSICAKWISFDCKNATESGDGSKKGIENFEHYTQIQIDRVTLIFDIL